MIFTCPFVLLFQVKSPGKDRGGTFMEKTKKKINEATKRFFLLIARIDKLEAKQIMKDTKAVR